MIRSIDVRPLAGEVFGAMAGRLSEIYRTGAFSQGRFVETLEGACESHFGALGAVACGSGTAALHLTCLALELGPDDNVIVPANSFIATALAPLYCGAEVRLADVDPRTLNLSTQSAGNLVDRRTRAIIGVDFAGSPLDFTALRDSGAAMVLDGAHSHGASMEGRSTIGLADLSATSFFPSKVLGSNGEGGMAFAADGDHAQKMRMQRRFGEESHHNHVLIGYNYKMMEIVAAHMIEVVALAPSIYADRSRISDAYDQGIDWSNVPFRRQETDSKGRHGNYLYVVIFDTEEHRDAFKAHLRVAGVEAGESTYRSTINQHRAWPYAANRFSVPNAEAFVRRVACLPIWRGMSEAEIGQVIEAASSFRA